MTENDRPVTAAEAAEMIGTTTRTVLRLVERGRLAPVAKLPGRTGAYLFDRATVEAFDPTTAEDNGSAA